MTSDTEHPGSETGGTDVEASNSTPQPAAKKKAPIKVTEEVLKRRREGRIKAAATIASNLKKTGIGRFEEENKFALTSVKQVPLVNQKNYYTDYLKKDEQISFVRNWRSEKLMQSQNNSKLKKAIKKDDNSLEPKNFDDYDLGDIEAEMRRKREEEEALARAEAEAEAEAAAQAAAAAAGDDVDDDVDDDEDDEVDGDVIEHKAKQGYDTIVIQPGSANIRIGRATDAFPLTIPTVLAMRPKPAQSAGASTGAGASKHEPTPVRTIDDSGNVEFEADFARHKDVVTKDFKARMKYYKRRILPNSRESAANYNRKQEPERIPDHNDPYKKEWLDLSEHKGKKVFVGEDALNLPIVNDDWLLRFPIKNGVFNDGELYYASPEEVIGDLVCIITDALQKLDITKKHQLAQLKAVLVIPDLYDKTYVENWVAMLFKQIGFGKVAIIQEAVAATFGAGAQSACVVDVGAQTTTISCVDEGLIINDSRVSLTFGGDNITETFIKLLLELAFPYKGIDLSRHNDDWELAESLKKNYVTFLDADIAVQLYNFYKRKPNELTEKYEFKVFDEVMIAPLGLFYPGLFQIDQSPAADDDEDSPKKRRLFPNSTDQYSGKPNNPFSKAQENVTDSIIHADLADDQLLVQIVEEKNRIKLANPYSKPRPTKTTDTTRDISLAPLEKAIIESITNAGIATDFNKVKRLYDNLLIVGGGFGKIPAFDLLLTDRINIWRPKFLSSSTMEEILEYVTGEKLENDNKKKELIEEFKAKKLAAKRKSLGLDAASKPAAATPEQEATGDETTAAPAVAVSNNLDDIELEESELKKIDKMVPFELDLDYIDSISDKGSLLLINVLPPPREFDPEVLTWKGGSVYSRLKVINEMWVTQNDWDLLGSRCLYYKSLFNY